MPLRLVKSDSVNLQSVKAGLGGAEKIFRRTKKPVPVFSARGDVIAQIRVADAQELLRFPRVPSETFRRYRVPFLYAARWGVTWGVTQRGQNFVIEPPDDFPDGTSPSEYGVALTSARTCSDPSQESKRPTLRGRASAVQHGTELQTLLLEALTKIGALEERLRRLETTGGQVSISESTGLRPNAPSNAGSRTDS